MNDADIIVALGDTAAVARFFGVKNNTVSNWKMRGISWRWRPLVKDAARRKKIKIPDDFLTSRRGGEFFESRLAQIEQGGGV